YIFLSFIPLYGTNTNVVNYISLHDALPISARIQTDGKLFRKFVDHLQRRDVVNLLITIRTGAVVAILLLHIIDVGAQTDLGCPLPLHTSEKRMRPLG